VAEMKVSAQFLVTAWVLFL